MKNIEKHIDEIVSKVLAEAISFKADNILNKAKNGITESLHGGQKKIDVAEPKGKITAADFEKLRSIGFRVEEVDYTSTIPSDLVEKYCLAKGEIIPVVYK